MIQGRNWLVAQVRSDGSVIGEDAAIATPLQTRAEVLESLRRLNAAPVALGTLLSSQPPESVVEHLSRQIMAQAASGVPPTMLNKLKSWQNADGGFGGGGKHQSELLDTSFALLALRAAGELSGQPVARAVAYLAANVGELDSPGLGMEAGSRPYVAAYLLLALHSYSTQYSIAQAIDAARAQLLAQQGQSAYAETLLNAVGAIALGFSSTSGTGLDALRAALRSSQLANGSWENDPFLTALALRGLIGDLTPPPPTTGRVVAVLRDAQGLAPLAGGTLSLTGNTTLTANSAGDGRVLVADVPPGSYSVRAEKAGFHSSTPFQVTVNAGATLDVGTIDLQRLPNVAVLRGVVTDVRDNSPLAGVSIAVQGATSTQAQSGPDGRYEIQSVAAGAITILVSRSGYQSAQASGNLVSGQILEFSPALYPAGLEPPTTAVLIGRVVSAEGESPIAGAVVQVGTRQTQSASDGQFQLADLATGIAQVQISANGYLSAQLNGTLAAGVNNAGLIRLVPNLPATTSTVSGLVRDAANGTPMAGALVEVMGTALRASSGSDGRYRIEGISALPFTLNVSAAGFASRSAQVSAQTHGSYTVDVDMDRLAGGDFALESVVMSAPEYDPYSEIGVVGSVRNLGSAEAGLIFNAVVIDANQQVVRDVPAVRMVYNSRPGDNIQAIAPGATRAITITWGNLDDLPGNYTVLFRGLQPDGRVAVEGSTGYRVRALRRLSGSVVPDPPLLQAGLGQSVQISAELANLGNLPISAGTAELQVKLVNGDNRPPAPPPPVIGADLINGAPLDRPWRTARDNAGNVYTVNYNTRELLKIAPDASTTVLRTLNPYVNGGTSGPSMGTPYGLAMHPDGKLRVAWSAKYVSAVTLTAPFDQTNATGVTDSTLAYTVDAAGNEYFAGAYQGRTRLLKRAVGGLVSILAEAGVGAPSAAAVGDDGHLYTANAGTGQVFKIDGNTGLVTLRASGLAQPYALLPESGGSLLVAELTSGRIRRIAGDGTLSDFAIGIPGIRDLQRGLDGAIYAFNPQTGQIRKIAADGSHQLFASALVNSPTAVTIDSQGQLVAAGDGEIRRQKADGSQETIASGLSTINDVVEEAPDQFLATVGSSVIRAIRVQATSTVASLTGHILSSIHQASDGSTVVLAVGPGSRSQSVRTLSAGNLAVRTEIPVGGVGLLRTASGTALWTRSDIFELDTTGRVIKRAGPFQYLNDAFTAANGDVYVYDISATPVGLFKVNLATGNSVRVTSALNGLVGGIATDSLGRVIFGKSDRTIVRLDPQTTQIEVLTTVPSTDSVQDVIIDAQDNLYWRSNTALYRLEQGGSVQIASGVNEIQPGIDGKPWWKSGLRIYSLNDAGAAVQRFTLAGAKTAFAVVGADGLATWDSGSGYVDFYAAAGNVVQRTPIPEQARSMALTEDGRTLLVDSRGRMTAISTQGIYTRIGGDNPSFRAVRVEGPKSYVSGASGVYELLPDDSTAVRWTYPSWAAGSYGAFDIGGPRLAAISASGEVVLADGNIVIAASAPFRNANAMAQRRDGVWLLQRGGTIVEINATGKNSRILAAWSLGFVDLARTADEMVLLSADHSLYRLADDGTVATIATPRMVLSGAQNLAVGAQALYSVNNLGIVTRLRDGFMQPFTGGFYNIVDIEADNDGNVYVVDASTRALGVASSDGYRQVAIGFDIPFSVTVLSGQSILVGTSSSVVVSTPSGRWSQTPWVGLGNSSLERIDDQTAWILGYNNARLRPVSIAEPLPVISVGTVVYQAQRPYLSMAPGEKRRMDFGSWQPAVGGDYELTVRSLDAAVSGSFTSGLHVGSLATAQMSATPSIARSSAQTVKVSTYIEGGDFSSLSRVEASQLQLLLASSVYPSAMARDTSGALWYAQGSLFRSNSGGSGVRMGTENGYYFRGEVPIDSQQRAYAVRPINGSPASEVRRYEVNGTSIVVGSVPEAVQSMTIDPLDQLYLLATGKIYRMSPSGTVNVYATLPAGTPYGLTRDGAGNLYAQMQGNVIYRVDPVRNVTTVLSDAGFEYEGVNIAGTCGAGLFFTPASYPLVGQSGEEYTIAQVLGSTGEIGPILNGRTVGNDLLDMDFIVYDRFSSALLVMSESNSAKLFALPVTCGAIDVDLHVVLPPAQSAAAVVPPATQTLNRADGSTELIWSLRDVNRQGVELSFLTDLTELRRGEDRPVAADAWMEFRNTFTNGSLRQPVAVPRVHVDDLVEIDVVTDRASYAQNTEVQIQSFLRNPDSVTKRGRLWLRIEDAAGALVETLIDRAEIFGALESRELNPPFSTGNRRAGDYRVVAEILDEENRVLAADSAAFAITAGGITPTLTSTVRTDKPQYRPQELVVISAELTNTSSNQSLRDLRVIETILAPNGQTFATLERTVSNLEPGAVTRVSFDAPLGAAAAGSYELRQEARNAQSALLSTANTRFDVLTAQGNQALSGTLTLTPAEVRRGQTVRLSSDVRNRGNVALSNVPVLVRIVDPARANATVREWTHSISLEPGASVTLSDDWASAGAAVGDYVAVLIGAIDGQNQVLDQKPLRVVSVVLSGTVTGTPADARPGDTIALAASVRNTGNLAATGLPLRLAVLRADSGAVVREWTYTTDLAIGAQLQRSESLAASVAGIGDFQLQWSATLDGQTVSLAQSSFAVRDIAISGNIDATPASVPPSTPVQISGQVRNLGNLAATALPVRIEVRRRDTGVVVDSWNESANIAVSGTWQIARQWQGQTAANYQAVLLAQINGAWATLASDDVEVTAPAVNVDLSLAIQRDARLLVLVSCAPGQINAPANGNAGDAPAASACELSRQSFLEQFLSQRAIDRKVVTSSAEFMRELRCGRYNTYWLSGGTEKLAVAEAKELRETIYRGDGLLLDGTHDQRTAYIDELAGYSFNGRLPQQNLVLRGAGTLFPQVDVPTYGAALRLTPSTGQVQASFTAASSAASISNVYGQGHALTFAFDLVEVLQRDGVQPAASGLFDNGLLYVAPTVVNPDHARGSYVPVSSRVENRGQAVDLRLRSSVNMPAKVESTLPQPTQGDTQSATWDFNLLGGQARNFDLGIRLPASGNTLITAASELSRRNGALLEPLSNRSSALPLRDPAQTSAALIAQLNAATLQGGEAQARNRAVTAIQAALTLQNGNDPYAAIGKWIDAAEEIVRISSVPHASWRLANARLLEVSQRATCGVAPPAPCDVLGVASSYNGFFFGNYSAASSDVQGRLAAGGHISLNNYSIGDQLPAGFTGPSLVAGGNLTFPSGRAYRGDIVVGGSAAGVGSAVTNGLGPDQHLYQNAAVPIDFAAERTRLLAESARLATLTANTSYEYQWGGLYLHGDNQSALQVFNLPGTEVLDAHTFQVDRIPAGATVLFNIAGSNTGLTNMSLSTLIPYRNKVLFNFYQATTLQLAGVSVEGSILAPLAAIEQPQGVVWGTVVAQSWNGMMQINLAAYSGCTVAAPPAASLCTSNPSAPVTVAAGQGTFTAFEARERLEVRGGKTGNADWEWGLGTNTQAAGQFSQAQLNWVSGKSYRYILNYDGQGSGSFQVLDGTTSLFTNQFTGSTGRALRAGNALELYVKSSAGNGAAKIATTVTRLEGAAQTGSLTTLGDNLLNEARLTYFSPALADGFTLEGTVRLDFSGSAPPTGSRLNFFVTAGNLTCTGAAP
ncbi:MAG: choice-of-anchor A family protein [Lysobacterales bacterium]